MDFGETVEPGIISLSRLESLLFQKISRLLNFFGGLRAKHNRGINMPENEREFDKDFDLKVSPRLSADLKAVFRPQGSVPPEVDRAVLDQVHRHLSRRYKPRRLFRLAASISAAAAVIIFAFIFNVVREPAVKMAREAAQDMAEKHDLYTARKSAPGLVNSVIAEDRVDIDQNGHVDILDAFKLARHVESESTGRAEMKWDINGDGLVNRNDVDLVASAAVRLDKGVL
jgi:hypothetical protein